MATHRHTLAREQLLEEKRAQRLADFQARLCEQERLYAHREWRIIPLYPDYAISEYGDIKRIVAPKGNGNIKIPGLILKPTVSERDGYLFCSLSANGVQKTVKIHTLVAVTYIGTKPFPAAMIAHWDGDKQNNHYTNLRWTTAKENSEDSIRQGRIRRGETHSSAKLTWEKVREIRRRYAQKTDTIIVLGKEYGVSFASIWSIVERETWKE